MIYDLIIIGAGPAGITASIYASRYKINHLVIGQIPGGLITEAHNVCNFPGEESISGIDLMEKMQNHAKSLGAEIMSLEKVVSLEKEDDIFILKTESEKEIKARTLIVATGTKHRKLGLAEENSYVGKGVAYCSTCDAMFFKEKIVGVVGGGNSALTASLHLSKVASKVYLIVRGEEFKAETAWIEQVLADDKIQILYNTEVSQIQGENRLEKVVLSQEHENSNELKLDGLFVEIGTEPNELLSKELSLDTDKGYIVVDKEQKTSLEGVWAAGDITSNSSFFRQVITACSEGAVAAYSAFSYLQKKQ
jgi:thioredoxin reductase (NADPH)